MPAVFIGVLSALILSALNQVSGVIEHALWDLAPTALGVADGIPLVGILLVLTLTGAAVGLVVWKLPGHGGQDSATTDLTAPPLPVSVLPSLTLAVLLSLAGGVSLGPENPIIAINAAPAVALVALLAEVGAELITAIAAAATIGALFGTPVAAALIFTGVMAAAPGGGALWDKLFLPLVAAGAGSITMKLAAGRADAGVLAAGVRDGAGHRPADRGRDRLRVSAGRHAGGAGPAAAAHLLHRLRNPLVYVTLGGLLLGVLGLVGGKL